LRPVGSSFAGGNSGSGGSGGVGGGRASGLDLSGGGTEEVAQTELRKSSGNNGNSPGSPYGGGPGGGGGGGGSGGDGAPEDAGVAAVQEETGLKGLFNQARNAVMNAFGKSSANTRSARSAAAEETGGKKRKLRGLASGSDIGTKNMDIWRMVNMCANGETCVSNRNNYVENP
jgi:hypothetical protein